MLKNWEVLKLRHWDSHLARIEAARAFFFLINQQLIYQNEPFCGFTLEQTPLSALSWELPIWSEGKEETQMLLNFFSLLTKKKRRMGQFKLGWTWMKWTWLKVLKHTGKMPISLSPEICRLSICCLFYPSTQELKRERTSPRLLMLSRETYVMSEEFYFPITLPSFRGGSLHTWMIRSRKDKTLILSTHTLYHPHWIW